MGRAVFVAAVVSVLVSSGVFFALRAWAPRAKESVAVPPGRDVVRVVPALSGVGLNDGLRRLLDDGLTVGEIVRQPSTELPADQIIDTVPGRGVSATGPVRVIVSSGAPSVKPAAGTPTSRPLAKAPPLTRPPGQPQPPVGARDAAGAQDGVSVPRVTATSLARARALLAKAGLRTGRVGYRADEDRASGVVLRQSPSAGTQVVRGSAVDLVVNRTD